MSVVVEVLPDEGAPQVGVTVSGLDVGTSVISVEVSWDGGSSWLGVRGAERVSVTGGSAFFRDFVPPLNVAATYRLTVHTGSTPAVTEDTITVTSDVGWVQDPLNPRGAVPVVGVRSSAGVGLMAGSFASMSRRQAWDAVTVEGARFPVASVGARQAPSNVPLHLRAVLADQGALVADLRDLFDSAGTLVLRGLPDGTPLDPVAHVVAGDVEEVPTPGGVLGVRNDWLLSVSQVRPTSMRIAVPYWTYDQVKAMWTGSSYDAVKAARPGDTYIDWQRTPEVP